jgi:hypothetical protein
MNDRITSYIATAQTSVVGVSGTSLACTLLPSQFRIEQVSNYRMQLCKPLEIDGLCPMAQRDAGKEAGIAEKGERSWALSGC